MYGKHFSSMYEGSMVGAGSHVFAVWGYVISKADPEAHTIDLNPVLVSCIIGDSIERVNSAIGFLCKPDPNSHCGEHDGARLLHQGGHTYFVVTHEHYRAIGNNQDARAYFREAKRKQRAKEDELSKTVKDIPVQSKTPASVSVSSSASVEGGCKGETPELPLNTRLTTVESKPPKPKKEIAQPCFDSPAFLKAWEDWQEHRREIKKPLTPRASQEQMKEFRAWGEARAIKAIRHTIKKQWVGIREEDAAQPNANKPQVYQCR